MTIGNSVTSIGYDAFNGCDSLNEVIYYSTEESFKKINMDDDTRSQLTPLVKYEAKTPPISTVSDPYTSQPQESTNDTTENSTQNSSESAALSRSSDTIVDTVQNNSDNNVVIVLLVVIIVILAAVLIAGIIVAVVLVNKNKKRSPVNNSADSNHPDINNQQQP